MMSMIDPERSRTFPLGFLLQSNLLLFAAAFIMSFAGLSGVQAHAAQITLAWNAATEGEVAGYRLYYRDGSAQYQSVDVGNTTTHTLTELQEGSTYTFAASAYNDSQESAPSPTVTYTIPVANKAPIASNGTLALAEDSTATGKLFASDANNDPLVYSVVSAPRMGRVVLSSSTSGTYSYTPNPNINGTDSFTFKVNDGKVDSNTATITVYISSVNDPPVAMDDTATTNEGQSVTINILANDGDIDGDALRVTSVAKPVHGTVNLLESTATYKPALGFSGTDGFSYKISDGQGGTATGKVVITVAPVNHPPVASTGILTAPQGNSANGTLTARDSDGDALRYNIVTNASKGTVNLVDPETGAYTYTSNSRTTGTDSFTFRANDGELNSNTATVTVTIVAPVKIWLEAEKGEIVAPMQVASDAGASSKACIWVPRGSGGSAHYSFIVPTAGSYVIWASTMADGTAHDSFVLSVDNGDPIRWNVALGAANTWTWSQVKNAQESAPVSFYLDAGEHTLAIQQGEAGTKLDGIMITSERNFFQATVYEDAEDGMTTGWDVSDTSPAGAQILNVYDQDRESRVIELKGSGTQNGYRLRSDDFNNWHSSSQFVMGWSMKYSETFMIYVAVTTTAGYRQLVYQPVSVDRLGSGEYIYLGLGTDVLDGRWHCFVRNLQRDLNRSQPGVTILEVNRFAIRGSGRVDDVLLRN